MSKFYKFLFACFVLISFTSCKEDVELIGDFEETAVVYGLLDETQTVQYVKITRTFIGPGNSLDIAQIPDSSYFTSVTGTISEYLNGNPTGRVWNLIDTTITNKETNGVFYAPSQKVYCIYTSGSNALNTGCTYRLKANINSGSFEVSAETSLVNGVTNSFESQNTTLKFATNPGVYSSSSLVTKSNNGYIANTTFNIRIREFTSAIDSNDISIPWVLGENETTPGANTSFIATGAVFYDVVKRGVTNNPSIIKRRIVGIDVATVYGGEEYYNYYLVNKPSTSLAQTKPSYTNLTATNGKKVIGIFSSRYTKQFFKPFYIQSTQFVRCIDKKSTQELCKGPITGALFFCSNHIGDASENFYCP